MMKRTGYGVGWLLVWGLMLVSGWGVERRPDIVYTEVPESKFLQFPLRANFIKFFLQKTRQKYPCIGL